MKYPKTTQTTYEHLSFEKQTKLCHEKKKPSTNVTGLCGSLSVEEYK